MKKSVGVIDRRNFLLFMLAALPGVCVLLRVDPVLADSDNSGSDDSGSDDSDSGSGSDDDNESDDDSGKNSHEAEDDDHERARDAVREGKILPLREILMRVEAMDAGRVIFVALSLKSKSPYYTLKVQNDAGRVKTLRVNAVTGSKLSTLGWR